MNRRQTYTIPGRYLCFYILFSLNLNLNLPPKYYPQNPAPSS